MSNRQYVGARYVPKIMGEWNKALSYEALSVVTYLGNSFTSKKPVPSNIDISNTEYWVNTGNYNAQVENYRVETKEVRENLNTEISNRENADNALQSAINSEISNRENADKLLATKKREIILIGDSYSGGVIDAQHNGYGWVQYCKDNYSHLANFYHNQTPLGGVYGFTSTRPFLDVLKDCEQYIDDFSKISDIIVLGGTNDRPYPYDSIVSAIATFCNYAKNTFPNAKIAIGYIGNSVVQFTESGAYKQCVNYGAHYIYSTKNLICDPQYISDGIHLTQNGYDHYNPYIAEAVMFGETNYNFGVVFPLTQNSEYSDHKTNINTINVEISPTGFKYALTNNSALAALYYNGIPNVLSTVFTLPSLFYLPISYTSFIFDMYSWNESTRVYTLHGSMILMIDHQSVTCWKIEEMIADPNTYNTSKCLKDSNVTFS